MTKEVKKEEISTDVVVEDKVETKEPDAFEQRAIEMGWRPKEEFDGDDESFIDAKEFVRRKPLFDKIEHQSKEIKNVQRALEALQGHYTKVRETEYNKALAALKEARKEAVSDSDGDSFDKLDTEIKRVEKEAAELQQPVVQQEETQVNPKFQAWTNRNQWYVHSKGMRDYADELGVRLAKQGLDENTVLTQVEQAVKKEFPHRFSNPNKKDAPNVGESSNTGSRSKGESFELSEQERRVMTTLINSKDRNGKPLMTKEQYIADLKSAKGIK